MDGPAVAVNAHTSSASASRLCQGRTPWGNVSRTSIEVLTPRCSTDTSISRWRSVARDNAEGLPIQRSNPLENGYQLMVDVHHLARAFVGKLPCAEVWTQVSHGDSGYAQELAAA